MAFSLSQDKQWASQVVRRALSSGSNSELLKALVEAFPGSWFFTRLDASFAFVNQRACDELGYTRDELMALTLFDINPSMTPAVWKSLIDMGPFIPSSAKTMHRRKDGSIFPVEAFGSRIILGDENVAVSYVIDLSEEAQTREALAEKKHLLSSLLAQAPVLVWLVDQHGQVERSEGSIPSLNGADSGGTVGKAINVLFPNLPELEQATARAIAGESVDGTASLGRLAFEYRYVPRRNEAGEVVGATGVAMDVSARHAVEEANRRLMTAIEQSEESVVLLNSDGVIEYANPAFEAIADSRDTHSVGSRWIEHMPPSDEPGNAAGQLARAITEGSGWRGTIHGPRIHGGEYVEQVSLSPVRDLRGRVTGFVAVGRDITEQMRTQERLRQVEKMDAIGQLAGGIAHDFNNLLQVILGNVSLCMIKNPPEDFRSMLSEVEQAGMRASSLVAQLLTFGRKNAPKQATVELDYLVTRLLPLIRRMLGEHVHIEVAVQGAPLALRGDESQLEQVLLNLCVNARDAMPEGGRLVLRLGRLELETDSAVAQGLSSGGSYLFIEAIDTGCGMTEEIQRRIFEPFFTTKGAGSGIGLATVYAVAKRHGGTVEVRSQLGKGSQFRVMLRSAPEGESAVSPSAAPSRCSRTGRILLVEDDPSVRQVTRMFLERDGHQVLVAQDGVQAISVIERESAKIDLIVLDAIMPNTSGPEVYRRFRKQSGNPVLFVTGHGFNAFDALSEDSARAILDKPFTALELSEAMQKLLARAERDLEVERDLTGVRSPAH